MSTFSLWLTPHPSSKAPITVRKQYENMYIRGEDGYSNVKGLLQTNEKGPGTKPAKELIIIMDASYDYFLKRKDQ